MTLEREVFHRTVRTRLDQASFALTQAHPQSTFLAVRLSSFVGWIAFCLPLLGCNEPPGSPADGSGGAASTGGGPSVACEEPPLPAPFARLLTRSEYRRTVQELLGTTEDPTVTFPEEPEVNGFNNNARSYAATPLLVEQLDLAASKLAASAQARAFSGLVSCEGKSERECASDFIARFLRRAFRRAPSSAELVSFETLYDRVASGSGHAEGLRSIIEAALLSPQFLYRVEAPLVSEPLAESRELPLGPYELASRLSYFLWGSMPDELLLARAEEGALSTPAGIEAEARRLLADPRAKDRASEFHSLWLKTNRLPSLARDGAPAEFGRDLQRSLLAFLDDVLWAGGTIRDLLTTEVVYATPAMGAFYGYATDPSAPFTRVVPPEPRPGLLGQPALLTRLSLANQSSPIQRGVFVRDALLCSPVANPPPSVNNNPPDPQPGLTTRELFRVHTEFAVCAECHRLIDPVGFGFEAYDQLGRYRTEQEGKPIDVNGSLDEVPDPAMAGSYTGLGELSERLTIGNTVLDCVTRKWLEFAIARAVSPADSCEVLASLDGGSSDTPLIEVLVAITKSRPFRMAPHSSETTP